MPLPSRHIRGALALSALAFAACGDDDDNGVQPIPAGAAEIAADITTDRTFYAETTYKLKTFVHVANGATLTIRPGTRIEGSLGSALFVLRGARIMAEGRPDAPIVFTSDQPVGSRKPGDWGGLVIVGNGQLNRAGTVDIEGTGTSQQNYAIDYGKGNRSPNNADNSGVLRYVRVEFAGFGPAPTRS